MDFKEILKITGIKKPGPAAGLFLLLKDLLLCFFQQHYIAAEILFLLFVYLHRLD